MKKKNLVLGGLLLFTMTFSSTGCHKDDKKDEIIENPLDKAQYYIVGTVSYNGSSLEGVKVSSGDKSSTETDANGQYSLTVTSSSTQDVTFEKDGMSTYTAKALFISDKNLSQAILNVTLAKVPDLSKSKSEEGKADSDVVVKAPNQEDEAAAPATITLPAGTANGVSVTAVAYEEPSDVNATSSSLSNIYIETKPANAIAAKEYVIGVLNMGDKNEYFEESSIKVGKEDIATTKANGSSVTFNGTTNQYIITFPAQTKLAGKYRMNINFDKKENKKTGDYNTVIYNNKEYTSKLQIKNENYSAMENIKLTVKAKYGWEYSVTPEKALADAGASGSLAATIKKSISEIEGSTIYTKNEEYTSSLSGHKVLYFESKQNVKEKVYTFKIKVRNVSKSVTVKLNCYSGHAISYNETDLKDHSGGTTGN